MDKKTIIGFIIIAVILFGFTWYNNKQQAELRKQQERAQAIADSTFRAQNPAGADSLQLNPTQAGIEQNETVPNNDSIFASNIGSSLVAAQKGEEQLYTLENDLIKITISNIGGRIAEVELKEYNRYQENKNDPKKPVVLFEKGTSIFDTRFFVKHNFNDAQINSAGYYFKSDSPAQIVVNEGDGEKSISMRLYIDSTAYMEYLYILREKDYMVDMKVNFVDMGRLFSKQNEISMIWENVGNQNEKGFDNENNHTDIAYMYPNTDEMEKLGMSKEAKEESVETKIKWVSFKQQFFSSILIADDNFSNGKLRYETFPAGEGKIKKFHAEISVPFDEADPSCGFKFYFGPNKFSTLNKYEGLNLEKLVPLGWGIFGWVNRWLVIPIFDFLGKFINSFGLIILLLTIIIKILISPLTYKSYLSMAKMRLLKPEVDEIGKKYPDQKDAMKKQQATMELYKRAGASPMGGCIPMLIQLPLLFALFNFFPSSIELRGESFLWADDLSSYDSIANLPFTIPFYGSHVSLFALLMAVSMYFSGRINNAQMASNPQMAGMKFMSLYIMPVMMLMWFNNYASGLSYYYFLSTMITVGQTYAFRYAVDDIKLHAKMKENAKKPVKKSKWAARYEDMVKQQQASARQQQSNKKK